VKLNLQIVYLIVATVKELLKAIHIDKVMLETKWCMFFDSQCSCPYFSSCVLTALIRSKLELKVQILSGETHPINFLWVQGFQEVGHAYHGTVKKWIFHYKHVCTNYTVISTCLLKCWNVD